LKIIARQFWLRLAIPCAILTLALAGSSAAQTHSITFVNRCVQQVWLAELAPSTAAEVVPKSWALAPRCSSCAKGCNAITNTCNCTTNADCRFGAPAGTQAATCNAGHCVDSAELLIPEGWSGRFWPRTRCSGGSSDFTCKTGQCGDPGSLDCTSVNKSANRATLFEITTGATNGLDNYDVSLVSGYNLPIKVIPLLPRCPDMEEGRLVCQPGDHYAENLLLFKIKPRIRQARSTAKSANRENSPNSRLNPTRASSPVDLECRIPAKCAFFRHRGRESRKLKTRWRSAVDSNSQAT
jgi:thaumatin family protein